jgi:hypothetical protein
MADCYNVTSARPTGKASRRDPDHSGDAKIIDIKRATTSPFGDGRLAEFG